MLGGKVAYEFRKLVEGTFTRVMAGDQTLIEVINANAASNAPIQQAYRAALEQEPVEPVLDEICLGKRREHDDAMMDLEIFERKAALEDRRAALEERRLAIEERKIHLEKLKCEQAVFAVSTIETLKGKHCIDERTRLQFEDHVKNISLASASLQPPSGGAMMIANGDASQAPSVNETAALNVSIVAAELGFKCSDKEIINIGRAMAAKYRTKYGREPSKHKQYVKGNYVPVNSYMERDRHMMESVIRSVIGRRGQGGGGNDTESHSDGEF